MDWSHDAPYDYRIHNCNIYIKVQGIEDLEPKFIFKAYNNKPIKSLILSGDKIIAISSNAISQWSTKTQEFLDFSKIINPPKEQLQSAIATGEKKLLLVYENCLLLWDIEKSREIIRRDSSASCITVSGDSVIAAEKGGSLKIVKLKSNSDKIEFEEIVQPEAQVHYLTASRDGKYIAAYLAGNDNNNMVNVYDIENRQFTTVSQGKEKILYLAFLSANNTLLIADTKGVSIHLISTPKADSKLEQEEITEDNSPALN